MQDGRERTRLRLVQLACILLVLACIGLVHWRPERVEVPLTVRHWIVIAVAIGTGISGFTAQRRLAKRQARSVRSTLVSRWKAGHLLRLWTAMNVGLWAVILSDWGGPHFAVDGFFAISLALLVFWSPGPVPEAASRCLASNSLSSRQLRCHDLPAAVSLHHHIHVDVLDREALALLLHVILFGAMHDGNVLA